MKKLLFVFLFFTITIFSQDAPTSYTTNLHLGKWATGSNPGSSALNNQWQIIDDSVGTFRLWKDNIWTGTNIFNETATFNVMPVFTAQAKITSSTDAILRLFNTAGKNWWIDSYSNGNLYFTKYLDNVSHDYFFLDSTGNGHFTEALTSKFVNSNLIPKTTDKYTLGNLKYRWKKAWIGKTDAFATDKGTNIGIGGSLTISKDTGTLLSDINATQDTIDFGQPMTIGDIVVITADKEVEYIRIDSLATNQSIVLFDNTYFTLEDDSGYVISTQPVTSTNYYVTRDLDGSGANSWISGTPFTVRGNVGNGWIVLNATNNPKLSLFTQGSTWNSNTELMRLGELSGMPTYSSTNWGIYIGDASNYLKYDTANGLAIKGDGTVLDISSNSTITTLNGSIIANQTNISQNATDILLRATTVALNDTASFHWAQIGINSNGISSNVVSINNNANGISTNSSNITQNADNILLRVRKDSVISLINLSSEGILIQGDNIQLTGNTTVDGTFTLNGSLIVNGTVTYDKLNITNLSAISADLGTVTAGDFKTTGTNGYVQMNSSGITGYSNTLGTTFNIPTDGSAPTFSSGTITNVNYEIYTSGLIRTSATVGDGTANSAGILINNTGIYGFGANQTTANANFKLTSADGILTATNVNLTGEINANAGNFTNTVTVGTSSSSGTIQSYDYVSNTSGWKIAKGSAEFNGATITGGTFQTATSGQRVVIDNTNAITFYDASGNSATLQATNIDTTLIVSGRFKADNILVDNGRIKATNSAANDIGIWGITTNAGIGVYGHSTGGTGVNYGVKGEASGGLIANYGVYGIGSTVGGVPGYAGYFEGDVDIEYTLYFGTLRDVNLFRGAANILKTDDEFQSNNLKITNNSANASLTLETDNDSSEASLIRHTRGGSLRWSVGATNNTGTDDYEFLRYNNSGTYQGTPLTITRANGYIKMNELPSDSTGLATGTLYFDGTNGQIKRKF